MMFPATAACPPNIFTPRRLLCDSRPFFELPTPFLCAILFSFLQLKEQVLQFEFMLYSCNSQLCKLLTVTILFLVTFSSFLLEDNYFISFQVTFYFRSNCYTFYSWGANVNFPFVIR